MSGQGWWVGLICAHCGRRVTVGDADARFSQPVLPNGKLGKPFAEHYKCREAK